MICEKCGNEFRIGIDHPSYFRGHTWCRKCRTEERQRLTAEAIAKGFEDMTLACIACGASFIFPARDRLKFCTRGWVEPRRCHSCRDRKYQAEH